MGSSTNTMIIHHSVPDNSWARRWLPTTYSTPGSSTNRNSTGGLVFLKILSEVG